MLTSGSVSLLEMLKFFLEIEMVLKTRNNIKNGERACVRTCVCAYVRVCVCVSVFLSPGQLVVYGLRGRGAAFGGLTGS